MTFCKYLKSGEEEVIKIANINDKVQVSNENKRI